MVIEEAVRDYLSTYTAEDLEHIIEIAKEMKDNYNRNRFDSLLNTTLCRCDDLVRLFPYARVVIKDEEDALVNARIADLVTPNSGYTLEFWLDDNTRY